MMMYSKCINQAVVELERSSTTVLLVLICFVVSVRKFRICTGYVLFLFEERQEDCLIY